MTDQTGVLIRAWDEVSCILEMKEVKGKWKKNLNIIYGHKKEELNSQD